MKKYAYIIFIAIIAIVIQQSLISSINIFGAKFDIVYVLIICFSLLRNELESVVFALICGIIRDSFFPFVFGINCIIYIITAFLLAKLQKRIYRDSLIIPVFFTFVFTILKTILYYSYFYIASIKFDFKVHVSQLIFLESVYNSIVSIFLYRITKNICLKDVMQEEWKF
ncbi:rod shape-determining protein MreD [Caloramator sp. E03]|uniref:rod shape-determining protein MreD n=1 Tax=Caloramator sp. E03 TaxID=2576307 RepID=UPI00111000A8|nr:rod shape-determining protein MreD [Caloramator sp. E03]QCX32491.1 rod shape-determining protein MreD [Caloramator sp. E03]